MRREGVSGGCFHGRGGGRYFVSFVDELMGSSDELEAVHVVEFSGYFVPE